MSPGTPPLGSRLTASIGICLTSPSAAAICVIGCVPSTPSDLGPPDGISAQSWSDFSGPSWKPPTRLNVIIFRLGSKVTSTEGDDWSLASTATYWICGMACIRCASCAFCATSCCPCCRTWASCPSRLATSRLRFTPTTTAATLASAAATAAPRHSPRPRRNFSSIAFSLGEPADAGCASSRFSIRFQTLGPGCSADCSSVIAAKRSCQIRAAARTVALWRAMASKRRRAPPRSVPSA